MKSVCFRFCSWCSTLMLMDFSLALSEAHLIPPNCICFFNFRCNQYPFKLYSIHLCYAHSSLCIRNEPQTMFLRTIRKTGRTMWGCERNLSQKHFSNIKPRCVDSALKVLELEFIAPEDKWHEIWGLLFTEKHLERTRIKPLAKMTSREHLKFFYPDIQTFQVFC